MREPSTCSDVVFVGHSVSAMIGVLAHLAAPDLFSPLVLIGPSARYLDDDGYVGGFSRSDIDDLLETMDSNHLGWQDPLSGLVMANRDRPELKQELEDSFCRTRPEIARHFARVTFLGDNREDLRHVTVPTLVVQTTPRRHRPGERRRVRARPDPRQSLRADRGPRPLPAPERPGGDAEGDPRVPRHVSRVRDLFDIAPCGYAVLDRAGWSSRPTSSCCASSGASRDEVVGLLSALAAGHRGRSHLPRHARLPAPGLEGSVREIALDVVHADGTRVPVLLSANVDRQRRTRAARVRVVVLEARDRRRYETDLLEAVRATEAARRDAAELAETLQQTLIPPTPPSIDGLAMAAAYRPAGDGREVGGDFYDVFQVADGEWLVVIGDVTGKGVAAATVTSFVRHIVRDLAMRQPDPAALLLELNQALLDHPTDKFCTIVVVRLIRRDGDWQLRASAGGHPLPLLRKSDGTTVELGMHGPLVGVITEPSYATFEHVLGDDIVVLF